VCVNIMIESPPLAAIETPFLRSLTIQMKVIGALLMREVITRYGRHGLGFMWIFVEPMMFTLGVTALWSISKSTHGSNLPITEFAATGYSTVLLWRNATGRCLLAIEPNLALLYHRNVRVIDIYAARLILEIAGGTISLTVITLIFMGIGWMRAPVDLLYMIIAWLLLIFLTIALGLTVGALSERSETFERVWHPITYLLFPLSGAIFMVAWLPVRAQKYILWLPMVHCTEMLRHGYWGNLVRTYEDPTYLMLFSFILFFIGLALVKETGRRVEVE
jgi:capsular polysaccharide transport system permease protein